MKKTILLLLSMIVVTSCTTVPTTQNFQQIDAVLENAFEHARNWPPRFESETQRKNLEEELGQIITQLEQRLDNSNPNEQILFRLGKANTFAYNLDIPGSGQKADEYFAKLFQLNPSHAEGHLYYGNHILGRAAEKEEFESAIEHLQIAADGGFDVALNMIGLAYLHMGEPNEAKIYFQRMQKKYPENRQLQIILDSLEEKGK